MSRTEVRHAAGSEEVRAAQNLRIRVFCEEQGVDPAAELDGRDGEAVHLVCVEEGSVVGTCRLRYVAGTCLLGRMAISPERRRSGLGWRLLEAADRDARSRGAQSIRLHAQLHAESFYARGGFVRQGEEFVEEGIRHVLMEKRLE